MLNERDEFLISQLADGSIEPADRVRAEQLLASSDAARACFESYRRLDAVLDAAEVPSLASHITDELDRLDVATLSESDEMLIAEYASGTLDAVDRARAEDLLASNPRARLLLSDELSLDRVLDAVPEPSAELESQVVAALDDQDEAQQRARMRIGVWRRAAIAVAAVMLVGVVASLMMPMKPSVPPLVLATVVPADSEIPAELEVTLIDRPIDPKMFVERVPSGVIEIQPVVLQASLEAFSRW